MLSVWPETWICLSSIAASTRAHARQHALAALRDRRLARVEQDLVDQVDAQLAAALGQADVALGDLVLHLVFQLVVGAFELGELARSSPARPSTALPWRWRARSSRSPASRPSVPARSSRPRRPGRVASPPSHPRGRAGVPGTACSRPLPRPRAPEKPRSTGRWTAVSAPAAPSSGRSSGCSSSSPILPRCCFSGVPCRIRQCLNRPRERADAGTSTRRSDP